jgi:tetratricopeptide (TPR) repeat protein
MIGQLAVPGLVLVLTIRGKTPPIGQCLADVKNITYPNEATEIFLRSAGGRRRALAVDPDLSNLVAVLEGHPLSLRLLGSAAQGFGDLVSLRRRWEAAKADLLREGPDETRLTSTRASFRASLASPLLINSGKRLLGLLSLLPTGMEREDADLFLPGEGHEAASNVVSLQLVNEQAGRLTMLAPLREAALKENPADVTDRLRLIDHFLGVAKQAGKAGRKDWSEVRERVTREAGNLDAMCLLAIDEHPKPDLLEALRGLARFYRFTTMGSVRSLERAARHFEDATRVADAASCLMSLGAIAVRRLDNEVAQRYFSKALPMFREARSIQGEANCIQGMAKLELDRARYGDAEDYYRKAAALYKFVDDELGNANCIRGLGDIARGRNDYEAAKVAYEACIPIYQKVNDTLGEAICNKSLGDIALDRGDLESAQSAFQQAIPLFQELGDVLREAECRQGLGDIAERQSQAGRAAEQWRAALTLFSRIGYLFNIGHAHVRLSRVATNPEERQSHCAAASAAWLSIDRPDLVSHYME